MSYTTQKVNETTKSICDWIQNEIKSGPDNRSQDNLPEMIKALAALIIARASMKD